MSAHDDAMNAVSPLTKRPQPALDEAMAKNPDTRILLAEDNTISSELFLMMAGRLGFALDVVENGLEAVERVQRAKEAGAPYALLLIDAMMPVMGGVEATKRIRAAGTTPEQMPIITVTAATAPEELRSYSQAGMQAYLAKPVKLNDLAAAIDVWCGGNRTATHGHMRSRAKALRIRYEERKLQTQAGIEKALAVPDLGDPAYDELKDLLHKLAGTAGSFGEAKLSQAAAHCEAVIAGNDGKNVVPALEQCLAGLKKAG